MAKLLGLLVALTAAGVVLGAPSVRFSPPRRQRFGFVLPSRGERRAVDDHRTVLEIIVRGA